MSARPAAKLAKLLEQASPEDRQVITAWLLDGPSAPAKVQDRGARRLTGVSVMLDSFRGSAAGEECQLVTVRLPQDLHGRLRDWCGANGFSMASVIRGLVERFLDAQPPPEPDR